MATAKRTSDITVALYDWNKLTTRDIYEDDKEIFGDGLEGPIADTVTVNRNWILGSIEQLDKPQEVPVPQFVADYIKYAIENDWDFQDLFKRIEDEETVYSEDECNKTTAIL